MRSKFFLTILSRNDSMDEAKRNPGSACDNTTTPDYVSLHPGYVLEHPVFWIGIGFFFIKIFNSPGTTHDQP